MDLLTFQKCLFLNLFTLSSSNPTRSPVQLICTVQQIKSKFHVVENATKTCISFILFFSFKFEVVCHKKVKKLKNHKELVYTMLLIPHILFPNLKSGFAVHLFIRTMLLYMIKKYLQIIRYMILLVKMDGDFITDRKARRKVVILCQQPSWSS